MGPVMRTKVIAKKHMREEAYLPHNSKETLDYILFKGISRVA